LKHILRHAPNLAACPPQDPPTSNSRIPTSLATTSPPTPTYLAPRTTSRAQPLRTARPSALPPRAASCTSSPPPAASTAAGLRTRLTCRQEAPPRGRTPTSATPQVRGGRRRPRCHRWRCPLAVCDACRSTFASRLALLATHAGPSRTFSLAISNADVPGNDLGTFSTGFTQDQCAAQCAANSRCAAYLWSASGTCWMKATAALSTVGRSDGRIAALPSE
jgi:hypothetical protein